MSRRTPHPDDFVGTVQCPKCKRPHTTRFAPDEKPKDIKCPDCIRQEIEEAQERDRRPQG